MDPRPQRRLLQMRPRPPLPPRHHGPHLRLPSRQRRSPGQQPRLPAPLDPQNDRDPPTPPRLRRRLLRRTVRLQPLRPRLHPGDHRGGEPVRRDGHDPVRQQPVALPAAGRAGPAALRGLPPRGVHGRRAVPRDRRAALPHDAPGARLLLVPADPAGRGGRRSRPDHGGRGGRRRDGHGLGRRRRRRRRHRRRLEPRHGRRAGKGRPGVLTSEMALVRALAEWLPPRRWFGGKDVPIDELAIGIAIALRSGDPALHHLILDVRQNSVTDHYQLLLGVRRELPHRLRHAEIGTVHGAFVYDAAHDADLTRILLDALAAEAAVGPLRFHRARSEEHTSELQSLPITAEQSNTSLLFGDTYICKLFRRLSQGVNLDLEVNLALTRRGCPHVPAVHGWIELEPGPGARDGGTGEPVTLALLSDYLHTGADGWSLAIASVRDWFAHTPPAGDDEWAELDASAAGGDFAAEAERLGAATAEVHRALAGAFGVRTLPAAEVRAAASRMNAELTAA